MKKFFSLTLILVLITVFFTSCKKDKGEPPVLPPQESMLIDFSNFSTNKKAGDIAYNQKGIDDAAFQFAALVIKSWNDRISIAMLIPVAAFKKAVDQNPAYLDTKTWQWSFNVTVAGVTYNARLTGQIGSADVVWKMYVTNTSSGAFTDFIWFEGTSKLDGTGGKWTIYENPASPAAILQIDWTKTGTSISKITYTYVKTGDSFNTSSIEYGLTTGAYNAFYNIHYYNGLTFSDVNIEWNTSDHSGRIKSSNFLDGTWFCWDSNKTNTLCQ
jgi:hypothetical protein